MIGQVKIIIVKISEVATARPPDAGVARSRQPAIFRQRDVMEIEADAKFAQHV
jgi:hypothetical protein